MPDVFHACEPGVGVEPGLALIDEVGKRALTTAFIQVIDVQIDMVSVKNVVQSLRVISTFTRATWASGLDLNYSFKS